MPTTCFHTPYNHPADSGDQAWPCIPLLSPELLCSGELGKTFRDPYWWDFHCSVSFCRGWGGTQAFLGVPPSPICSIYSIKYWAASRPGGSSEQTSCGEEECSVARRLKVRQESAERAAGASGDSLPALPCVSPHYLEQHGRGHTHRTSQILARSRRTRRPRAESCFLPMSRAASN